MKGKFLFSITGVIVFIMAVMLSLAGLNGNGAAPGPVYAIDPMDTVLLMRSVASGTCPDACALEKDGLLVLVGNYGKFGTGSQNIGFVVMQTAKDSVKQFFDVAKYGNLISQRTAAGFVSALESDGWKKLAPAEIPAGILSVLTGPVEQLVQYAASARFMLVIMPVHEVNYYEFMYEGEDL